MPRTVARLGKCCVCPEPPESIGRARPERPACTPALRSFSICFNAMEDWLQFADLPTSLIEAFREHISLYSIAFLRIEGTHGQRPLLLGSGTLVAVGDKRAILTARHVVAKLPKKGRLPVLVSRTFEMESLDTQGLRFLQLPPGPDDASGPDLGAVVLAPAIAGTIGARKSFYPLDLSRERLLNDPPDLDQGVWFINGYLDERTSVRPDPSGRGGTTFFYNFSGAGRPRPIIQNDCHDYFAFPVSQSDRQMAPKSFGGMSGGSLWQVVTGRDDARELIAKDYFLSGVVFYQEPTTDVQCGVKCHGRLSVYKTAYDLISSAATM